MANRLQPKQIENNNIAPKVLINFSASGLSNVVTAEVTAAASADGVPLVASTGTKASNGFIVTAPINKANIVDTVSKKAIEVDSNEVFGRLTEAAGVYTLTYYTIQSGVETNVTLPATNIDFEVRYNYSFKDFPFDALIRVESIVVGEDPAGTGGKPIKNEVVTITALNTIANLSKTPIAGSLTIDVNGKTEHTGGSGAISVIGKAVTWSAVNAEYDLETTDTALASYFTLES